MPKLIGRVNVIDPYSFLFTSPRVTVKLKWFCWSEVGIKSLLLLKMILCVFLLIQTVIFGFCLQYTYTQLLEASYLLFVSSTDFIYDRTIKKNP